MTEQAYQAVGAIAGRLDGGQIHLLDGETFAATPSPVLAQWIAKHPTEAAAVRIWLAYPRTLRPQDGGLAFYLVGTPEDQDDPRWAREIDRFVVKGQVMDAKAKRDFSVIRIPRNTPAPAGKRRERNWLPHLLFLRRALRPVQKWKATDVWLDCKREGRRIFIASYRPLHHHQTTIALPVGIEVPWPLRATRSTVVAALKPLLPPGHKPPEDLSAAAAADDLRELARQVRLFNDIHRAVTRNLEGSGARGEEVARQWAKFLERVLSFLQEMEPGQLAALCRKHAPTTALRHTLQRQLDAWFTVTNPNGHRLRVFFSGKPVPRSVAKALLSFYQADEGVRTPMFTKPEPPTRFFTHPFWIASKRSAEARARKKAEAEAAAAAPPAPPPVVVRDSDPDKEPPMPIEEARQWLWDTLGIPLSFSSEEVMAALVQMMEEDGLTPMQIKARLGLLPSQLAQFKRVRLPQ